MIVLINHLKESFSLVTVRNYDDWLYVILLLYLCFYCCDNLLKWSTWNNVTFLNRGRTIDDFIFTDKLKNLWFSDAIINQSFNFWYWSSTKGYYFLFSELPKTTYGIMYEPIRVLGHNTVIFIDDKYITPRTILLIILNRGNTKVVV